MMIISMLIIIIMSNVDWWCSLHRPFSRPQPIHQSGRRTWKMLVSPALPITIITITIAITIILTPRSRLSCCSCVTEKKPPALWCLIVPVIALYCLVWMANPCLCFSGLTCYFLFGECLSHLCSCNLQFRCLCTIAHIWTDCIDLHLPLSLSGLDFLTGQYCIVCPCVASYWPMHFVDCAFKHALCTLCTRQHCIVCSCVASHWRMVQPDTSQECTHTTAHLILIIRLVQTFILITRRWWW